MVIKKTNVEEKLRYYRNKTSSPDNIFEEVKLILQSHRVNQYDLEYELKNTTQNFINNFKIDSLESDRIYHISHIKKICIDYRLRFLDSKYFKGDYPQEAITEIKKTQKTHEIQLKGLKIVAPSKLFKLKNADDPLLFAPMGNDYFYLIHKWGNDLHPFRKLLMLPFKSFFNLFILVLLISFILTEMLPIKLFAKNNMNSSMFWVLFIFMFKMVTSIVLFYGVALGKNFNPAIWKSKYFNA